MVINVLFKSVIGADNLVFFLLFPILVSMILRSNSLNSNKLILQKLVNSLDS